MQNSIAEQFNLHPLLAQLLINRGVKKEKEINHFLKPQLADLNNPFLLDGVDKAINRIKKAFHNGEKILIYGDYDVDGITSTALLFLVLSNYSTNIYYYIPDRFEEGYGIGKKGIDFACRYGIDLVITVDCGITSIETIKELKSNHIDTIVTDHHQPLNILPEALAIINPKCCNYPFKELAGVGVAFKLAQALLSDNDQQKESIYEHLDLVALGTIADSVLLCGENRILVKNGIRQLQQTNKIGLRKLLTYKNRKLSEPVSTKDLAFDVIPILNSAGRIASSQLAVDLILTTSSYRAEYIIKKMIVMNDKRKALTEKVLSEAKQMLQLKKNIDQLGVIVLANYDWHPGVNGIVASKLMEEYNKPFVIISLRDGIGKGSGRNSGEFDFAKVLTQCSSTLNRFGGHQCAAGITILESQINEFDQTINKIIKKDSSKRDADKVILKVDSEMIIESIDWNLLKNLSILEPYGPGNPEPLFCSYHFPVISWKKVGKKQNHLKISLGKDGNYLNGIAFKMADRSEDIGNKMKKIDLVFQLGINRWNGQKSIQLLIKDIKLSEYQ